MSTSCVRQTITALLQNKAPCSQTVLQQQRRSLATRGARGHGWYVQYRKGKGGRHLQGRYHNRESLLECEQWNQAVLELGSTPVYMDVVLEPKSEKHAPPPDQRHHMDYVPPLDTLEAPKERVIMDLATTVMPESTENFVQLCQLETRGYKGSKFYRMERNVGICGGDVLTNKGKTGLPAPFRYSVDDEENHVLLQSPEPMKRTILRDPLALWHVPGAVTMLVTRVHDVDSRFLLCTEAAPHMDGIHRCIGLLRPESIERVRSWMGKLITRDGGLPQNLDMIVVGCGLLGQEDENDQKKQSEAAAEVAESAA